MARTDTGTGNDPIVAGLDGLFQIGVRERSGGNIAADGSDLDFLNNSRGLHVITLQLRCRRLPCERDSKSGFLGQGLKELVRS